MTFGNFILRLRARLQDRRTMAGAVISSLATSGARWDSTELIEIANQSLNETIRSIYNFPDKEANLLKQLAQPLVQAKGTVSVVSGSANLPSNILHIVRLIEDGVNNRDREFQWRNPDEFFGLVVDDSSPLDESYIYTVVFDVSSATRKILVKPTSYTQTVVYSGVYSKFNYTSSDTNTEIHIQGMDDFLLDVAERECRDREHNWQRSQILDMRIMTKMGMPLPRGQQQVS